MLAIKRCYWRKRQGWIKRIIVEINDTIEVFKPFEILPKVPIVGLIFSIFSSFEILSTSIPDNADKCDCDKFCFNLSRFIFFERFSITSKCSFVIGLLVFICRN